MKLDLVLQRVRARGPRGSRSPPPERAGVARLAHKHRKPRDKWAHVPRRVDASPPALRAPPPPDARATLRLRRDNLRLLTLIRNNHFTRGRVDCSWPAPPLRAQQYHRARVDFAARVHADNRRLHRLFTSAPPRLTPTAELERWWAAARRERERRARGPWLLAPPAPQLHAAFRAPDGVRRPRVSVSLAVRGGAALGALRLELFADACPRTAALFLALLRAAPGYSGTRFYRKVPGLYWSGGDVARDWGRGRVSPPRLLEPENFHYPHSAPGLLTMHVDGDGELCGTFSITFKPLPKFDLRNVVFGRVVFPSRTYEAIRELGATLSSHPVVEIRAAEAWA